MDKVRIGIIGLGNIGQTHVNSLLEGRVPRGQLTTVADAFAEKLPEYAGKGLQTHENADDLIRSPDVDAVMICTPTTSTPHWESRPLRPAST